MRPTFATTTLLLNLVVIIQCQTESSTWEEWKSRYGKQYDPQKYHVHRQKWEQNRKLIEEHNRRYELGLESYSLKLNKYSDMDPRELKQLFKSLDDETIKQPESVWHQDSEYRAIDADVPDEWDWRSHGLVTNVKDQGLCVCGNAYAAVGALEGQLAKTKQKLISLSAQQIVDCSGLGCSIAGLRRTYNYLLTYGIQDNQSYPWTGSVQHCKYRTQDVVLNVTNFTQIKPGDELELKSQVFHYGPISVTIKFPIQMMYYKDGIIDLEPCIGYFDDQPLLVVGYGIENGTDYWLLKGSYGTDWGIQGYAKMRRNHNNMCAIASQAYYPIV